MATALQLVQKFYPNVVSIRDSHKALKVTVTRQDAQSKAVKNHQECALAHACKRELNATGAIICVKTAYLVYGDKAVRYLVPESLGREITSFDRNAPFEPGDYQLSGVPKSVELGTKRKWKKSSKKVSKALVLHRTENIRTIDP